MTEDENSWVFDSLVCFLKGPIWDAPIQNFIEEKSLIFEPNNVENEEDYHKIFDEYKNLVDFMLGNFMEDIGITPAQFEYACFKSRQRHHPLLFDKSTFEQIWAANNYDMFKRMMTQRNVELQLQALELIERKYGILPQSFIPNKKHQEIQPNESHPKLDHSNDIEKVILNEVAKKFVEEEHLELPEVKSLLEEKEHLEITRDKISSEITKSEDDITDYQEQNRVETKYIEPERTERGPSGSKPSSSEMIKKNEPSDSSKINQEMAQDDSSRNLYTEKLNTSQRKNPDISVPGVKLETKKVSKELHPETLTTEEEGAKSSKTGKFEIQSSGIKQIDEGELKKRQEYLRKQRDKLVALKREERRKQFGKPENENVIKKMRPKSAKAAQAVLTGEQSVLPSPELQLRKALAERLKLEVVEKNKK